MTPQLLTLYAYLLKPGGLLYFVSDVVELFDWMVAGAEKHPVFERVCDSEFLKHDFAFNAIQNCTEEGKKVSEFNWRFLLQMIRDGKPFQAAVYTRCI